MKFRWRLSLVLFYLNEFICLISQLYFVMHFSLLVFFMRGSKYWLFATAEMSGHDHFECARWNLLNAAFIFQWSLEWNHKFTGLEDWKWCLGSPSPVQWVQLSAQALHLLISRIVGVVWFFMLLLFVLFQFFLFDLVFWVFLQNLNTSLQTHSRLGNKILLFGGG